MRIINKKVSKLVPYEKNPRKNDQAVEYVANSIKRFGIQQPIVIDKNDVIVAGHTRVKACLKLGIDTVPCVIADELTKDEIDAYRLADNKSGEMAEWDFDLLKDELDNIDLDMSEFGFDLFEDDDEDLVGDDEEEEDAPFHRDATMRQYNLELYDDSRTAGFYQLPTIKGTTHVPSDLIGFNYCLNSDKFKSGLHCFIDDYQFERLWQSPQLYVDKIKQYDCFLSPDFSMYMDMPMAMKIWNIYRSRMIGQFMQDNGILVIPTLMWAEPETLDFCFEGLPKESTVAVSTIGVKRNEYATDIWYAGMEEAMEQLHPCNVLVYGGKMDFDYGDANVIYFDNKVTERMAGR